MDSTTVSNIADGISINWDVILPILTYFGGLITFWFYDRKIKKHQLKEYEKAETDSKKAFIRANIIKETKGRIILKVYNSGKSAAYNVRLEFTSDMTEIFYHDSIFPYEKILPQDGTSLTLQMCIGASDKIEVKLIWDDDYQKNNINTQTLTMI